MVFRESINQNQTGMAIAAVGLLVVAILLGIWKTGGFRSSAAEADGKWYYALESGQLFAGPLDATPPLDAPTGGEGVQAHVFTCDDSCGNGDLEGLAPDQLEPLGLFVGYLETMAPKGVDRLEIIRNSDASEATRLMQLDTTIMSFALVRPLLAKQKSRRDKWLPRGQVLHSIQQQLNTRCPGKDRATQCFPGSP